MSQSIAVLGSDQVPLVYKVPVPGTLTAIAASGTFDGSAAAAFQPCLSFYDSDGNLLARATAPTVAAGASAEVSWFPRVGGSGGAGGNGWQFDTDNEGGWGYVQTNASISGISPDYDGAGLALVDGQADGIVIDSDSDVRINPVQNGSVTLAQLGNTQDVLLYGGQKVIDLSAPIGGGAHEKMVVQGPSATPVLTVDGDGNIDAGGNRIQNGADGVAATDFATVEQLTAGGGVTSIDTITGAVTLVAGAGIGIADNTPTPGKITVSTSGVIGGPFTRGNSTVTYTASNLTATVTITHGLGVTPTAISLQGVDGVSALGLEVIGGSVNATTFQCRGFDTKGTSRTGTQAFYWVAYA